MLIHPEFDSLSDDEKQHVRGILQTGCDRETAVKLIGRSLDDLRQAMTSDAKFTSDVRRAEASCEFRHMKNLHEAAEESKNWRVSVWWLERRAPDRFARRDPGVVTTRDLESFVGALALAIAEDVHDPEDRARLRSRLKKLVDSLHGPVVSETATTCSLAVDLPDQPND